ncbi:MAG: PP2C family protein-serine/threonine phosphatase, partial [Eggerthella lenta]
MAADRSYKSTPRTRKGALTSFGSRTDIGCLRDHNEDSLVVTPPLFAVADGMGGHAAGEVASEIAVRVLSELAPEHPDGEALGRAIEEANRAVIQAAREGRGRQGMGTTMTAAMLEGERLVIAQVGDSRAYLLHQEQAPAAHARPQPDGRHDRGRAAHARRGAHASAAFGDHARWAATRTSTPTSTRSTSETGDRLLICSDGLSGMIFDDQIENTLRRVQDPQRCASQLVNEAIAAGGHDNVTVIVADVTGYAEVRRKKLARKTKLSIALVLVLFAAIVAGAAWGTQTYLNTAAYLANDNGKVAVYRGVPGSVLGLSFSHLERTTDVTVADLQPGVANRLHEGIRVDDMEAADALVKE